MSFVREVLIKKFGSLDSFPLITKVGILDLIEQGMLDDKWSVDYHSAKNKEEFDQIIAELSIIGFDARLLKPDAYIWFMNSHPDADHSLEIDMLQKITDYSITISLPHKDNGERLLRSQVVGIKEQIDDFNNAKKN
jgi:hypothetical protein